MHSLLILSILLFGTSLASSPAPDINEEVKQVKAQVAELKENVGALLSIHYARTFSLGSTTLYTTNKKEGDFPSLTATCTQARGYIPSPKNEEENAALHNVVKNLKKEAFLVENKETGYTNWGEGEPDTAGGTKKCMKIVESGKWRAAACDENLLFICEFPFKTSTNFSL